MACRTPPPVLSGHPPNSPAALGFATRKLHVVPPGVHPRGAAGVLDHRVVGEQEAITDVHIIERVLQPGVIVG